MTNNNITNKTTIEGWLKDGYEGVRPDSHLLLRMKEKTLHALRLIAKKRKVPSYSRYTKVELARLLDEGCRRHYAVTSDDRITYTARELRAIAKELNVPRYTIYPKSELFEILGFNSIAGA
ncbi:hypothetical protein Tco_0913951 [Tanacetum coccineum]